MNERKNKEMRKEMSSKLVRKISHPDLIWTLSLWVHQAQPITYNITNTGLLLSVDMCERVCVIIPFVLNKLTVCQADGEFEKLRSYMFYNRFLYLIAKAGKVSN